MGVFAVELEALRALVEFPAVRGLRGAGLAAELLFPLLDGALGSTRNSSKPRGFRRDIKQVSAEYLNHSWLVVG